MERKQGPWGRAGVAATLATGAGWLRATGGPRTMAGSTPSPGTPSTTSASAPTGRACCGSPGRCTPAPSPGTTCCAWLGFDTIRTNIEFTGAQAVDLPIPEGLQPSTRYPFKGNMDVGALERLLAARSDAVPLSSVASFSRAALIPQYAICCTLSQGGRDRKRASSPAVHPGPRESSRQASPPGETCTARILD
jgi:hypothetical protein